MSKIREDQIHKHAVVIGIICDMCGERSPGPDWSEKSRGSETVKLQHEETESYPEDVFGKRLELDFCPFCMEKEILPWLESKGVKVNYVDLPE